MSAGIDITIPYWGDPSYMKEAVDSVLRQTSPHWRLSVIDDAYPDPEIGRWLSSLDDPRISYQRKPENQGIIENFRSCLRAARYPLVNIMGADDRLLPTYVDSILTAASTYPSADIIQPGVRVIDEFGAPTSSLVELTKNRILRPRASTPRLISGEPLMSSLMCGNWLYWPSLAFRTEDIQQYDFSDKYPIMLDLDIITRMLFNGSELLVLDEELFEYRRHSQSLSSAGLTDGSRFTEERAFYAETSRRAREVGWQTSAWAARARPTSRAHAALTLPGAALGRRWRVCGALMQHALRP